jgi:AAA domain
MESLTPQPPTLQYLLDHLQNVRYAEGGTYLADCPVPSELPHSVSFAQNGTGAKIACFSRHTTEEIYPALDQLDYAPDRVRALVEGGIAWYNTVEAATTTIIPGVLAASGIAIMGGEPKTGKSWLTMSLALSVANKHQWLEKYEIETPGRVLYIATEGNTNAARHRFGGLAKGMDIEPSAAMRNIDLIWRKSVALDDPAFLVELAGMAHSYVLIVVDVLRDAWSGDENDSRVVSPLIHSIREITNFGPTVLLVQHFGKAAPGDERRLGQRLRGSGVLHASADSLIYLERSKSGTRTRASVESKDDATEDPFSFAWPTYLVDGSSAINLDWQASEAADETAKEMLAVIVDTVTDHPGESKSGLKALIKGRWQIVLAAIDLAIKNGLITEAEVGYTDTAGRQRTKRGLYAANTNE